MSLSVLRFSSMIYKGSHIKLLQRPIHRTFALDKEPIIKDGIPPHLIKKAKKRKIPEPYMRILKQVPPRHKDKFGQGIIGFIFLFTFGVNGVYMWQAYTLKDRLKAQGAIEGNTDERWTNIPLCLNRTVSCVTKPMLPGARIKIFQKKNRINMGSCGSQCSRSTNTECPDILLFKQQRLRAVNSKKRLQIRVNDQIDTTPQQSTNPPTDNEIVYNKTAEGEQAEVIKSNPYNKLSVPNMEPMCSIFETDPDYSSCNEDNEDDNDSNDLYRYDKSSNALKLNVSKLMSESGEECGTTNLIRRDTETSWDYNTMDEYENDIKQQMQTLRFSNEEDLPNALKTEMSNSSLYRQKSSNKWDTDDIDERMDTMGKQLKYLIVKVGENGVIDKQH